MPYFYSYAFSKKIYANQEDEEMECTNAETSDNTQFLACNTHINCHAHAGYLVYIKSIIIIIYNI